MKRIALSVALLLAIGAFVVLAGGATKSSEPSGKYRIELDDSFGLVPGSQFKVGGVPVGKIGTIELCAKDPQARCQNPLHAVVTATSNQHGFHQFHSDAFCQSRPESLIGEYFVDCTPGLYGKILPPGATIPVTRTQSTIPPDLLNDIMRMPYRQRLTLIINELGAAVAGRSGDLGAALRRAVPALTQTDNLLNLLANDSHTLQALTADSDSVITALANNSTQVQRFITEANNTATDSAKQDNNLRLTWQNLPGFLEQLKPTMAKLESAALANIPVLQNLNALSCLPGQACGKTTINQLQRLFTDLPPFSHSALPALRSLGQASITGRPAMIAALPTVHHLNEFAKPTPELARNLAIVLQDLDTQKRAVEPDSRSPGGKGFSGLQALLQYVFNQPLAINAYSNFGHLLTVEAFADPQCSPYGTPQRIANNLASSGPSYRHCYSWLGPNQPGINEPDPSNPGACVPDPGGAPPGHTGPPTSACKLAPNPAGSFFGSASDVGNSGSAPGSPRSASANSPRSSGSNGGGSRPGSRGSQGINLQQSVGQFLSTLGGRSHTPAKPAGTATTAASSSTGGPPAPAPSSSSQAKQLLNYLLAP